MWEVVLPAVAVAALALTVAVVRWRAGSRSREVIIAGLPAELTAVPDDFGGQDELTVRVPVATRAVSEASFEPRLVPGDWRWLGALDEVALALIDDELLQVLEALPPGATLKVTPDALTLSLLEDELLPSHESVIERAVAALSPPPARGAEPSGSDPLLRAAARVRDREVRTAQLTRALDRGVPGPELREWTPALLALLDGVTPAGQRVALDALRAAWRGGELARGDVEAVAALLSKTSDVALAASALAFISDHLPEAELAAVAEHAFEAAGGEAAAALATALASIREPWSAKLLGGWLTRRDEWISRVALAKAAIRCNHPAVAEGLLHSVGELHELLPRAVELILRHRPDLRGDLADALEALARSDAGPSGARALRLLADPIDDHRVAAVAAELLAARPWTAGPRTDVAIAVIGAAGARSATEVLRSALEVCHAEAVDNIADALQLVDPSRIAELLDALEAVVKDEAPSARAEASWRALTARSPARGDALVLSLVADPREARHHADVLNRAVRRRGLGVFAGAPFEIARCALSVVDPGLLGRLLDDAQGDPPAGFPRLLAAALRHSNDAVVSRAVAQLAGHPSPEGERELLALLDRASPALCRKALDSLASMAGISAVAGLREYVASPHSGPDLDSHAEQVIDAIQARAGAASGGLSVAEDDGAGGLALADDAAGRLSAARDGGER